MNKVIGSSETDPIFSNELELEIKVKEKNCLNAIHGITYNSCETIDELGDQFVKTLYSQWPYCKPSAVVLEINSEAFAFPGLETDIDRLVEYNSLDLGPVSKIAVVKNRDDDTFFGSVTEKEIISFLESVGQQISLIIEGKLATLKLEAVNKALITRNECNRAIIEAADETELLERICEIIVEHNDYSLAWVGLLEDSERTLCPIAERGHQSEFYQLNEKSWHSSKKACHSISRVLDTHKEQITEDIQNEVGCQHWHNEALKHNCRSCLSIPLLHDEKPIGVLIIQSSDLSTFSAFKIELLKKLANDISFGITNYRLKAHSILVSDERNRLARAVEQVSELIIIADKQGNVEYVNKSFEELTGFKDEDFKGKHCSSGLFRTEGSFDFRNVWRQVSRGESWNGRYQRKKKNGSHFDIDATISPVLNSENQIKNFVIIERDITRELSLEQQTRQSQKLEAIGTLAGGIAHDFNNLLFAMQGFMTLSKRSVPENHVVVEYLDKALKAGARAEDLVKQILTFSRQTEEEPSVIQLTPLTKEAVKMMRSVLPATIEVFSEISVDNDSVLADPSQIYQVIVNLCSNAGYEMMDKGGLLTVKLESTRFDGIRESIEDTGAGDYIKLSVSDTGRGIPLEIIEKIFDPFFTTKPVNEGTGLGLALVHGIVTGSNGHINVVSFPDKGATFEVFLPVVPSKSETEKTEPTINTCGTEKILVVDDESAIATLEQLILEEKGYDVTICTSSQEALNRFNQCKDSFDLIITDQTMPDMTGEELSKKILKIRNDIPILLLTGFSHAVTPESCDKIGIKKYLNKPVDEEVLTKVVREVLDNR